MRPLLDILTFLLIPYAAIVAAAWFGQRGMMYYPDGTRISPQEVGLSGVEEVTFKTPDGETLIAWHGRAAPGRPTLLYFTGNGGSVAWRAESIAKYQASGYGVFMLNYRSYGGSTGSPSEQALIADGLLAYDHLTALGVAGGDIVAHGESLGGGVAVRVAVAREVKAVVLEAPFTSAVDVAASVYWFLPVRLLLKDKFETIRHIGAIKAPLLVVQGAKDTIINPRFGRRLFDAAPEPKEIAVIPGAGHNNLYQHGAWERIRTFLDKLEPAPDG